MLFNDKVIVRHIDLSLIIPKSHAEPLAAWAKMIGSKKIFSLRETELHSEFTSKIMEEVLGYRGPSSNEVYTLASELAIAKGRVDLALGTFGEDIEEICATFELKGADCKDLDAIMPGRNRSAVQQAWDYAIGAPGVRWVLVTNYLELRLYAFGQGTANYERFFLAQLTNPEVYARFMLLLSAESLLCGRTTSLLEQSLQANRDVSEQLYKDYKELRLQLIEAIESPDAGINKLTAISTAQKILDRTLFVAFAEDTGLLPRNILTNAYTERDRFNPRPVWDNFKGLFRAVDEGSELLRIPPYNGGLFERDPVIENLKLSDTLCASLKQIGDYDFASEISVTILGHIFEQSVSDIERLQAIARGEYGNGAEHNGRRKRDGIVYTPDYIARFIVSQTLGVHLKDIFTGILATHAKPGADLDDYGSILWCKKSSEVEAWTAYRDRLRDLRIIDPACGSGVFLIMAFDFMKEELQRVNAKIMELSENSHSYGDLLDYVPDSDILVNNLFGVDLNLESVEITKLSLWIRTARRGTALEKLSQNIRVGDSLIEDSNIAYLEHGFSWNKAFSEIFEAGGFDIVIGNPPYVRMEFLKPLKPYLEQYYEVASDRADLYCYFYERGLRLLKPGGRLGYISSNTFFKTGSGMPLREYLLRETTLEGIVDFGNLQLFEGVTTYPVIMIMKRAPASIDHKLRFWKVVSMPDEDFQSKWEKAAGPYPQVALSNQSWELEAERFRLLREKIRAERSALGELYELPLLGVKTGLNQAFVIDTKTMTNLCIEDPRSEELLKPLLEGKDLKRWRAEPRGLWLIYIPKNQIDIDDYPAIRDWLLPFKERLEKRATKQKWFELQQAQEAYLPKFEGVKIAYKDIGNRSSFHIDTSGALLANTGYFIPSGEHHLTAYLNSKVFWFIYLNVSAQIRGGFVRLFSNYLESMPIPNWTDEIKNNLDGLSRKIHDLSSTRLKLQSAFIRRIPDLCPQGQNRKLNRKLKEWWKLPDFAAFQHEVKKNYRAEVPLAERSDWEEWMTRDSQKIARLSSQIHQIETKINKIVYNLFDLTRDEIVLLEDRINGTT